MARIELRNDGPTYRLLIDGTDVSRDVRQGGLALRFDSDGILIATVDYLVDDVDVDVDDVEVRRA